MRDVGVWGGNQYDVAAVVCEHGEGVPPTIIVPFKDEWIADAVRFNDARVAVLGANGSLAVHDARTGALLSSAQGAGRNARMLACGRRLLIYGYYYLASWSLEPLEPSWQADCILRTRDGLRPAQRATLMRELGVRSSAELSLSGDILPCTFGRSVTALRDGRAFFPIHARTRRLDPMTQKYEGGDIDLFAYCIVDAEHGVVEAASVQTLSEDATLNNFMAASPSGRFALRSDYGEMPYSSGGSAPPEISGFGRRTTPSHRDAKTDGIERFGITLELWRLGPAPQIIRRLTVRMIEQRHIRNNPTWGFGGTDAETLHRLRHHLQRVASRQPAHGSRTHFLDFGGQSLLRPLHHTVSEILWEHDDAAFWIEFRNGVFRRVTPDGDLSPLIVFRRFQSDQDPLRSVNERGVAAKKFELRSDGKIVYGGKYDGYVVLDPALSRRTGDLIIVEPEEDGFHRPAASEFSKAIDKVVREKVFVRQKLRSMDEAGLNVALLELASKLDGNVAALRWGDLLRFRFVQAGRSIKEEDVFGAAVAGVWTGALPGLRAVLRAYLGSFEGGEGSQPWFHAEEGIPALAHALRAQVLLDPDDFGLWREYLRKRDAEHECFLIGSLMPEYLKRFGWRGEPALRFGIAAVINQRRGGSGASWNSFGLLDAAEDFTKPDWFVDALVEESGRVDLEVQQSGRGDAGQALRDLGSELDRRRPFQAAVAATITQRLSAMAV